MSDPTHGERPALPPMPDERRAELDRLAQRRADDLKLPWQTLSPSHQDSIRQTIWAELNWLE